MLKRVQVIGVNIAFREPMMGFGPIGKFRLVAFLARG